MTERGWKLTGPACQVAALLASSPELHAVLKGRYPVSTTLCIFKAAQQAPPSLAWTQGLQHVVAICWQSSTAHRENTGRAVNKDRVMSPTDSRTSNAEPMTHSTQDFKKSLEENNRFQQVHRRLRSTSNSSPSLDITCSRESATYRGGCECPTWWA